MAVDAQHKEYTKMVDKWKRCLIVCKGQDAVYEAGTQFLPKLTEQTQPEYDAYKKRTPFYNATWRTVVGLQGMLFRKPPRVKVPAKIEKMLEDITLSGTSLHIFTLEAVEECLKLGRLGIYVDFPVVENHATLADMVRKNLRPTMKLYSAMSIINWKTRVINNRTVLSMVVLQEVVDVPEDEFTDKEVKQWRVLDLVPNPAKDSEIEYIYRVRVFRKSEDGKEDILVEAPAFPKIDNKNLDHIPFQFVGVDDVSWVVDEPPLIDLVDMNIAHYRVSADYEHGCHFTGLPTPVISGYTPEAQEEGEKTTFCIGSTTAWVFPRPDAKATYLEFTGQGLGALKENLERKEGHMAILGARMLEVNVKGGVESANTAALHRGGEQSMLSSVAQAISMGITKALNIFCAFAGAKTENPEECKFELNRDFFPVPMDALTITALIAGWQNGAYSYETMLENLKKGEIVAPNKTAEEELKEIEKNPPPAQDVPTTPGNVKVEEKSPKAKETPATPAKTITQQQNGTGD